MKKVLLSLMVFAVGFTVSAQNAAKKAEEVIKFNEIRHNFGKIKQGTPVTYDFVFSNIGSDPLVIENASASCGCTTPSWPQQPIMKSKEDKVKAGFNAAAAGPFEKTIFVKIKGVTAPYELKISGEVVNAADFDKGDKK